MPKPAVKQKQVVVPATRTLRQAMRGVTRVILVGEAARMQMVGLAVYPASLAAAAAAVARAEAAAAAAAEREVR